MPLQKLINTSFFKVKDSHFFHPPTLGIILLGILGIWLGFPNNILNCPFLIFLWPLALAYLGIKAPSLRYAFTTAYLCNFLGLSSALYWLTLPIQEVGGLPIIGALACALTVPACLALFPTLFSLALFLTRKRSPLFQAFFGALVWLLQEILTVYPAGFPWVPLSGALIVYPSLVQSAEYLGANGTGALFVFLLSLGAFPWFKGLKDLKAPLMASILLITVFLQGYWSLKSHPLESLPQGTDSMGVLFVEGNVDQNQKWVPSLQRQTVEHYLALTTKGLQKIQDPRPLIIWPETAMPFFLETQRNLANLIYDFTRAKKCPLLLGAPGTDPAQDKTKRLIYNRATLLGPAGNYLGHYDKEHLVPFGEYLPSFLNFSFLEPLLQEVGVYSEGKNQGPLIFENMQAGMLICYEGIFPNLAQNRVQDGANILIDISNDSWFSLTPASRQHLYLTCLRALEQGRYILRGTNTGLSAIIDPRGRIVLKGQLFQATSFYGRARLLSERTFFHLFYRYELVLVLVLFVLTTFFVLKKKTTEIS